MDKKALQQRGIKKTLTIILAFIFILQCMLVSGKVVVASSKVEKVYDQKIASGIHFQKNKYSDYGGQAGKKESEFIITADLNDPTVNVITGKAGDKVLELDTVSNQIAREQDKGQNVVAGINGDMFNISVGTMHYGTPQGLQVKGGNILVGFETIGSGPRYPVFAIDKKRRALITNLVMDATLAVVDDTFEAANGKANPDLTTTIDTINRNNTAVMDNQMILATPQLGVNPTIGFTAAQAANATLTVLKNISGGDGASVKLGKEYVVEVASIGDTASTGVKSITIPVDGMVMASQGTKATWVKEHLKAGDKIRFSFNLKDQQGNRLDLIQAVTAWLPLVENGHALTQEEMLEKCKNDWDHGTAAITAKDKARTALGFTADNKIIALAFDGGGARKESFGLDLPGMAARMKELGVVAAVSLDGGGSTQMNTRLFGETNVEVIDCPSDGKERPVTNTILFASNAPPTYDIKELRVNRAINIYKNSSYTFTARGVDSNGNPADLSKYDIQWSVQPASGSSSAILSGSINNAGVFKAGERPANEMICARVSSIQGNAQINVLESLKSLAFTESGVLAVQPNVQKQLHLLAYTEDGQSIIMPNAAAKWTITPSTFAAVDASGLVTPLEKGSGAVIATVGEQTAALNLISGLDKQPIDSFETNDASCYPVSGYVGGTCQTSAVQVKDGRYSLKVDYDYAKWGKVYNGTIDVKMDAAKKGTDYTSWARPKKIGMWVYGDGQSPWLRVVVKDGNGNQTTLNLASAINWSGWKYVDAAIPEDIPMPISLDCFYMVETNKSKNLKGTVYFDDVCFTYTE